MKKVISKFVRNRKIKKVKKTKVENYLKFINRKNENTHTKKWKEPRWKKFDCINTTLSNQIFFNLPANSHRHISNVRIPILNFKKKI